MISNITLRGPAFDRADLEAAMAFADTSGVAYRLNDDCEFAAQSFEFLPEDEAVEWLVPGSAGAESWAYREAGRVTVVFGHGEFRDQEIVAPSLLVAVAVVAGLRAVVAGLHEASQGRGAL
jgi:hypothetical protein